MVQKKLVNRWGVLCLFLSFICTGQNYYNSTIIPESLLENVNAVIRYSDTKVRLKALDEMLIERKRIVTVFNKKGAKAIGSEIYYDNSRKIKALSALIYDGFGREIKKIKKSDFKDVSAVEGGTLYSDSRVKYLDYTPTKYPYTVELSYTESSENTVFIPVYYPLSYYNVSLENSSYSIIYPVSQKLKHKAYNTEAFNVEQQDTEAGTITFTAKHIKAIQPEEFSVAFNKIAPYVLLATNTFSYKGVKGTADNWNTLGQWMYNTMIKEANDLPEATKTEIKDLVKGAKTDIEKAKLIYKYVQDKVRYISVQVGVGGWKPFKSSYVDELSYGDCKALTNYTMTLLKAVDIEAYYTIVFAGKSQKDIRKDFTIMHANHAILNIPQNGKEDVWLECTSQDLPFGFIGSFTDDRDVLVVTPEGGKIKHTKKYTTEENTQATNGSYTVTSTGDIHVNIEIASQGIAYYDKYYIENYAPRERDMRYKERWGYINNITIDAVEIENDKANANFKEKLEFTATKYAKRAGNRLLFSANVLNRNTYIPKTYKNRQHPIEMKRGFTENDMLKINIPEGYNIESVPDPITYDTKFGNYHITIDKQDERTLLCKRQLIIKDGEYPKEDYAAFRAFFRQITKADKSKIALIKK